MAEAGGSKKVILALILVAALVGVLIAKKMCGGSEEILEAEVQVIET